LFPEELWNDLHLKLYGMEENTPARGWDLGQDIITKTGRRSVLEDYFKKKIIVASGIIIDVKKIMHL
jgi:endonuclease-3